MFYLFVILLILSPILLFATYFMTLKIKSFSKIFVVHTIAFAIYMLFVINFSKLITGHDEYGLGQIGLGIIFIIAHIIVGFAHGLYITIKNRQHQS